MSLSDKVVTGVVWRFLERVGSQGIQFVVTLVLARLLTPSSFGTVALLYIFISISNVLVIGGLGTALVQKKELNQTDYCTVFYLNIVLSLVLYLVLFVIAPFVADFYHDAELVPLLLVLATTIILTALNCVQDAFLQREMLFKLSFRIGLVTVFATGIIGCSLAYNGFGAWALVFGTLGGQAMGTIVRWLLVRWRPGLLFSWSSAADLFSYGWKVLLTSLCNTSLASFYGMMIGRVYSPADLAYYNRGYSMSNQLMDAVNGAIGTVSFPALAKLQTDKIKFLQAIREMIRTSTFIVAPLLFGLAATSESVIILLLGEQWNQVVPYMRVFSVMYAFYPTISIAFQSLLALGRSDITLKLEIVKNVIAIAVLLIFIRSGTIVLACVVAFFSAPIGLLLNFLPNRKILGYRFTYLMSDFLVPVLLAALMGALVFCVNKIMSPGIMCLAAQMLLGASIYCVLTLVFQRNQLEKVSKILLKLIRRS